MGFPKIRKFGKRSVPDLLTKVAYNDIVNDLETGGSGKVLSAEMGKKLNDKVEFVDSKYDKTIKDLIDGATAEFDTLGKIEKKIETEIEDRKAAIKAEDEKLDNIEEELTNKINKEIQERIKADNELSERITNVETTVSNGVVWKGAVDTRADLDNLKEESAIIGSVYYVKEDKDVYLVIGNPNGDYKPSGWANKSFIKLADFHELNLLVANERKRAEAKEAELANLIKQEVEARRQADNKLKASLDNETAERIDADNKLKARLDIVQGDETVEGSIKKAKADAIKYADLFILRSKIEVSTDEKKVKDNSIELEFRPTQDGILYNEVILSNGLEVIVASVKSVNGRTVVLDTNIDGEYDGYDYKVQYFYRNAEQ